MAVPGGRHPVNSFGSGGGARGRSTTPQRLPESSKTLRVYIATRDAKGKPVNNRKMVHVTLERPEECNLVFVNEKLRQQPGCELRVICDSSGAAIIDDLTTRTPDYWGYGRGGATNATKFYALPDAETSDDDEWTGHGGGPKIRITDEEIDRIATSVAQKRIDMPMRNFLICLYCAGTSQLPIICTTCGHVIGCKRCVDSYIAEGAGEKHCPMETCQENWPRTDDGTHT
uniref:RING-type domain-containing protein n=1 Tax=Plectus sambesii TaxID=2011161 RepID=A0A914X5Z7_9BILA